jgi:predicted RNA-binding Zn-ribbon protein involved in translation (DUF1610 family)
MIKAIAICSKCKKETATFDDGLGTLVFDFSQQTMSFSCPNCGYINIVDFGEIQKALERKTRLPSIGSTKY